MKNSFYVILILIIIGLSYLRISNSNIPSPTPTTSPLATTSPTPSPINTTSLTTQYFTLNYPLEATTPAVSTNPDSIEWRVVYMGESQKASGRTQTELFDGYAVSVARFEVHTTTDSARLQAEADRQGTIDACGDEGATPITEGKVGSYPALTFFGRCLGEATQYYLINNDALYRITAMVVGPEADLARYNQAVQSIFASLKFD